MYIHIHICIYIYIHIIHILGVTPVSKIRSITVSGPFQLREIWFRFRHTQCQLSSRNTSEAGPSIAFTAKSCAFCGAGPSTQGCASNLVSGSQSINPCNPIYNVIFHIHIYIYMYIYIFIHNWGYNPFTMWDAPPSTMKHTPETMIVLEDETTYWIWDQTLGSGSCEWGIGFFRDVATTYNYHVKFEQI